MPLYDFKCTMCQKEFESIEKVGAEYTICLCGRIANKIFSGTKFIPFKPYVETNLGDEPILIDNPKKLRQECNKVGADYI